MGTLNQLVDGLTGLERILTTPIPFSYVHDLLEVSTACLIRGVPPQVLISFVGSDSFILLGIGEKMPAVVHRSSKTLLTVL